MRRYSTGVRFERPPSTGKLVRARATRGGFCCRGFPKNADLTGEDSLQPLRGPLDMAGKTPDNTGNPAPRRPGGWLSRLLARRPGRLAAFGAAAPSVGRWTPPGERLA